MKYYYDIKVKDTFENTREKVSEALSKEGFGILTEIDVKEVFSKKLGLEFRNYIILGACNPSFSYKAIQADDKIGTLLPCNLILQDTEQGYTEVTAVDPTESMKMVSSPEIKNIAETIKQKLINALNTIKE